MNPTPVKLTIPRAALEGSGQWVAHQTYSPLLKFVPEPAKRKQGFDLMREVIDGVEFSQNTAALFFCCCFFNR